MLNVENYTKTQTVRVCAGQCRTKLEHMHTRVIHQDERILKTKKFSKNQSPNYNTCPQVRYIKINVLQ